AIFSAAANTAFTTINFNDYYASNSFNAASAIPGNIGATDRTNLAGIQAGFGQNVNSLVADPLFNSTTNLQPQTGSPVLDSGSSLSGTVTPYVDITGATRVDPPSMGAYEAGIDTTVPVISYSALLGTNSTSARTLTATITDGSGVPTAGAGLPVLYWKINAGSYTAATASSLGSNQYQFSFGAGVVVGDTVSYYVVAQDNATPPNVTSNPLTGAAGFTASPPAVSTPPTTPNSYTIQQSVSGGKTVGAGGDFPTLTAAIGDLNNKFLTGPVVVTLLDSSYSTTAIGETFPIVINANGGSNATNTITIK